MRTASCSSLIVLLALGIVGGCAQRSELDVDRPENVAKGDGLVVKISLPKRDLEIGQDLRVTVTAINTTDKPITLHSPSGAPVLVRVVRRGLLGSEDVRFYPRSAMSNIHSWVLPVGRRRTFDLIVPVEPDWPVAEILYVSAELNGYPKVAPSVFVIVHAPGARPPGKK